MRWGLGVFLFLLTCMDAVMVITSPGWFTDYVWLFLVVLVNFMVIVLVVIGRVYRLI